jgi:Tol biopolymer transport system component
MDSEIGSFSPAALSPDGQTIAYDRAGVPWLYRLNGGSQAISLEPFGLTFRKAARPAWSPDGQMLAWRVFGDEPGTDGWGAIAVLNLSQQKGFLLHRYSIRGGTEIFGGLAWSPDGKWLAVVNEGEIEKASMWVMRVDGSEEHHLGETELPIWSPDSRQLVFSRLQSGAHSPYETETLLVGIGDWQLHQLDLPDGARVKGWVTLQP